MSEQNNWRHCGKCRVMFYDGESDKGICAAGGEHEAGREAAGYNFVLPYDVPVTANSQDAWRHCGKCRVMFYDGESDKGICAAGGEHEAGREAAGYNFVLPYDVPVTANSQDAWRHCGKCRVMFYDGESDKGICAAGGEHEAVGYNFVLSHNISETPIAQTEWRPCRKCRVMFFDGFVDNGKCAAGGAHERPGNNERDSFSFTLGHPIHPMVELKDEGTTISVSGIGFTPNNQVRISYTYMAADGLHRPNVFTPEVRTTETDGSFTGVTLFLTGGDPIHHIDVRVQDRVTDEHTEASLRGDT